MSEEDTYRIQIDFAMPVALSNSHQRRLVDLISDICDDYEARHPERVMWPAGIGAMPVNIWSDEPSFDSGVLHVDCAERERYDTDAAAKSEPQP